MLLIFYLFSQFYCQPFLSFSKSHRFLYFHVRNLGVTLTASYSSIIISLLFLASFLTLSLSLPLMVFYPYPLGTHLTLPLLSFPLFTSASSSLSRMQRSHLFMQTELPNADGFWKIRTIQMSRAINRLDVILACLVDAILLPVHSVGSLELNFARISGQSSTNNTREHIQITHTYTK